MTVFVGGNDADIWLPVGVSNNSDDNLRGKDGNDILDGGNGNDTIDGGNDRDLLRGGSGNDVIYGGFGEDVIYAGTGADTIYGEGGVDLSYNQNNSSDYIYIIDPRVVFIDGGTNDTDYIGLDFRTSNVGAFVDLRQYFTNQPSAMVIHVNDGNTTGNVSGIDRLQFFYGSVHDDVFIANQYFYDLQYVNPTGTDPFGNLGLPVSSGTGIDGNDGNDLLSGGYGNDIMNGGAGDDTIYGNVGNDRIDGSTGDDFINGNLGNDIIFGSQGYDTIYGEEGNDTISGGDDEDIISGGSGYNILNGDNGNDILIADGDQGSALNGGAGNDTLITYYTDAVIDGGADFDSLVVNFSYLVVPIGTVFDLRGFVPGQAQTLGTGSIINVEQVSSISAAINGIEIRINDATGQTALIGNGGIDRLYGNALRNVISGGGGADFLSGGGGDDVIRGDDGNDTILGGMGNDTLTGGLGADYLIGGADNDTLSGGAGMGNTLQGGTGNDIYFVETSGDSIIEYAGEGNDVVYTALPIFTQRMNVEILTYTGAARFLGIGKDGFDQISGGLLSDDLYGRGGDDVLAGGAGAANTLIGGTGNDIYYVDAVGDSTIEVAGEGIDEVVTTYSVYSLQANIENLTIDDALSHEAVIGNDLDNVITGNLGRDSLFGRAGNDILRGGEGAANTLLGNQGDDIYYVEVIGDSVIEFAGEGTDTVFTALSSFVLRENVENLSYTGSNGFTGVGNTGTNFIGGGNAADFLSGMGGNDVLAGAGGADILLGGAGSDTFSYAGGESGYDRILDFVTGVDIIALRNAGFVHTATIDYVQSGAPVATSTNSTFLYNVNNGILSYDADGSGAGAAFALAQLKAGLTLTAGDFIFY